MSMVARCPILLWKCYRYPQEAEPNGWHGTVSRPPAARTVRAPGAVPDRTVAAGQARCLFLGTRSR